MKKTSTGNLLLFTAILFLSCINKGNVSYKEAGISDDEILIGSSSALTGHASFLGSQLTRGSLALIKEINETGGIHGRKIKLIVYDDKYEPESAIANTNKLIKDDRVFMLFDYVGTPTAKVVMPIVNREKIPILGLFTGAIFLRYPTQPFIFNVRASYKKEVEQMIDYWLSRGKKKIGIFFQDDDFGYSVLENIEEALRQRNLKAVSKGRFTRGKPPEINEVKKMAMEAPEAVMMVGTSRPLATFVNMAVDNGMRNSEFHTVSFVGSEAFAEDILSFKKNLEKNVYVTQVVPSPYDLSSDTVKEFNLLFKKYYPEDSPNYVALEGFINGKILVEALKRAGKNLTRAEFVKTLERMSDYNAGTGMPSYISTINHNFFIKVFISKIVDKKFEIIKQ